MPRWFRAMLVEEAEAAVHPDAEDESGSGASSSMRWQGRPLRGEDGAPADQTQRDFIDPASRILATCDGFVQGYNGSIAVDAPTRNQDRTDQQQLGMAPGAIDE